MQKIFFFFMIWMCLITNSNQCLANKKKDIQQINDVLLQQQTAWNRGDLNAFMSGYWRNDSLQFITVKGITKGWDNMLNRYQNKYPDKMAMGVLNMQIKKIEKLSSNIYYVIGSWELTREKDKPGGYFTLLFKKINGQWKIVKDHTS
jgi:ketosteroid isomerase-like protein